MLIALMADIHANREAFEACLWHARAHRAQQWIFLGDHVNYGADPEWVVETIMDYVSRGAIALLGNHDAAVADRRPTMGGPAEKAIEWTRVQLGATQRAFLAGLPLTFKQDDTLFVHADATAPRKWNYVADQYDAARSLKATRCRMTICGHVHKPATYNISETGHLTAFRPITGAAVPLLRQRRWLAVLGSVGQPRDGNPAASYAILDTERNQITYFQVPYDIDAAAAKIREAGLPEMLAERLRWGE
jgi:diadenosine tetraphosphatase ApaH/serine/threonine PP2A family protein phosphatase